MNMKNARPNHGGLPTARATLTAALVALIAGAPVGLAQSSTESGGEEGLGALLGFLSGGSGNNNAQPQSQPPERSGQPAREQQAYYDANMTVELHVQDEELTNVLQMLSLQSERNIVASNEVSARVTANLYGVTFHEALDAILHVNGYGYIEKGNFVYVYPAEVLEQIEQASRRVEGRVFTLNFISAVDAADLVAPLLSQTGEIKTNGKAPAWSDPTTPVGNEEFASLSTLIVYDYPENIEAVGDLIEILDVRPAQILVEATIVQTALNEANAFGVDFSIIADFDYADFASPLGAVDALVDGRDGSDRVPADGGATAIVGTPGNINGPGTFKAGIVSNDVSVFLRMLNEVTSTTIISNPKVVTLNRQPGRVLVGRKVGYLQTTSTDTSTTQSVEFLDTGTQLNFRPFVTGDGIIRMELKPQVSEAALRSATDAVGAAVTIPDEVTNELVANVMVPDGHTIVLGGLFREATTTSRRQVPVLGNIPLIGAAFRGHDDDIQRQEIIFMITPSVVSDQVLVDQGIRGERAVERVRAGAREQTLPFSQQRQAAQLLVEAEQLAAKGETTKALHRVRRALHLVPTFEDAIGLRERLVNQRDVWPNESVISGIIHDDAEKAHHNILQHGWKGALDKVPAPEPGATAEPAPAQNRGAASGTPRRPVALKAKPRPRPESPTPAFVSAPDTGHWWTSPEFDVFMTYWAVVDAIENGREFSPEDRWWVSPQFIAMADAFESGHVAGQNGSWLDSPEFDTFMVNWAAAIAHERGEVFNPSHRWWRNGQFRGFVSAFVGDPGPSGTTASGNAGGSEGPWWTSPEFRQFVSTWATEAAREAGRDPSDTGAWFNSPEFHAFMQAFDSAVTEARAQGELPTPSAVYTNVPTDSQD
jgi:type IV pilus assembly protein PilQ